MSIAWFLPTIAYEVIHSGMLSSPALYDVSFWTFNFMTATVGFFLNIASMLQVQYTSPLTHMIVGSLKGGITSLLGVMVFGNTMTAFSVIGLGMLLASTLAYSIIKSGPSKGSR